MLREGEAADLQAIADSWGVPIATAGWVLIAETIAEWRSIDPQLGGAAEPDLVAAVCRIGRALRRMRPGRLSMAFALGRLKGRKLELVGAGMPPALVYRGSTGRIEQVELNGVPLGSPIDFPYRKKELELTRGDTVLLMSDGFPESGSENHDPLGYEGAEHAFCRAAASGADPKRRSLLHGHVDRELELTRHRLYGSTDALSAGHEHRIDEVVSRKQQRRHCCPGLSSVSY